MRGGGGERVCGGYGFGETQVKLEKEFVADVVKEPHERAGYGIGETQVTPKGV